MNTATDAVGNQSITLPSQGALYGDKLPGGKVELRTMSAYAQSVLFSQGSLEDRLTKVINATAVLPKSLSAAELLTVDRMAILLAVRTLTFGPHYEFNYGCQGCGAKQAHTVNILSDLDETKVAEMEEPFTIRLPKSKKSVSLRFMRGKDEEAVAKHTKKMAMASADVGDPSALYRVGRLIETVDGAAMDGVQIGDFVRNMDALDFTVIENELEAREPGIQLGVQVECKRCEHLNELNLPFDREFFRPSTVRAKSD